MINGKSEILAPAGGPEQARAVIAAGCDAIYGGLKYWSARNRAANFTLDEYSQILNECHERGVKFYLTINTLLRNDELRDIMELFASDSFPLPDAVIVADIGLMRLLHNRFPAVEIHASTQFGACSIEDIRFLKTLGVKRAVLARELSLEEIKKLRAQTDMELEIFVYGSQCVCFSGQCLWGGLVNGSSGNRGRCIGMCRDTYRAESGALGQFMYPRDIDFSPIAAQLSDIGIDSLKIEGRLRNAQEIAQVVSSFRAALGGEKAKARYLGWLGGNLPVDGMFRAVNSRLKFSGESAESYGEYDLVYSESPKPHIHAGNKGTSDRYLFTSFCQPLKRSRVNISIKLMFHARTLEKLDFINTFGERKLFSLRGANSVSMTVEAAAEHILSHVEHPIYELLADVPEKETVRLDLGELDEILTQINVLCSDRDSGFAEAAPFSDSPSEITAQTDRAAEIPLLRAGGIKRIVFEISAFAELKRALAVDEGDIIYKLPPADFTGKLCEMLPLLHGKPVMASRAAQLLLAEKFGFSKLLADYTLNIWNSSAAALIRSFGVTGMTAHPELSAEESQEVAQSAGLTLSVIRKGKVPLGFMRGCWSESGVCSKDCRGVSAVENVTKGYSVLISCGGEFGFRKLFRTGVDVTCRCPAAAEKRYILTGMTDAERRELFSPTKDANVICAENIK